MNDPCENMRDKIADYVLGLLSSEEIKALDKHIGQCPQCKQYAESLQSEKRSLLQFGKTLDSEMDARQAKIIKALDQTSNGKTKLLSIWRTIMKSRITKLAAAAVIIIAVLIVVKMVAGSDNQNRRTVVKTPTVTIIDPNQQPATTLAAEKLEDELKEIKQMFAANDLAGLADMLNTGQWRSKLAAANYLGEIGDLTVISSLENLADKWEGDISTNPFASAVSKIQDRAEQQKQNEPAKQSKATADAEAGGGGNVNEIVMLTTTVTVVDEQGNAVANAEVKPNGLRTKYSRSSYHSWVGQAKTAVTDKDGVAEIMYPKYVKEKLETGEIAFTVEHPEYCAFREICYPVAGQRQSVVLKKGGIVRVFGFIGDQQNKVKKIYPQVSIKNVWIPYDSWTDLGDGVFQSIPMEPGTYYMRLIHFTAEGKTMFSGTGFFEAKKNEITNVILEIKPGIRVEGRIDDSVERPVTNGRVIARLAPDDFEDATGSIGWQTWTDIHSDGRFVFDSLPPDRLELTGICDGYVSVSPHTDQGSKYRVRPQLFYLNDDIVNVELEMEPSATCQVYVVNDANEPLDQATVAFGPNVRWENGGSQLFAALSNKAEDFLRGEKPFTENIYKTVTNEQGIAIVRNLPGFEQHFGVLHDDYEMPAKIVFAQVRRREENVVLVRGKTETVTVKMQKKGTDVLGQNPDENIAQVRKIEPPYIVKMDEPDDYVGAKVETAIPSEEFSGYVVDGNDNPLEGVLVDAWTWYNGNETYTDANGFFQLSGLEDDRKIEVRFSKDNYSPRLIMQQPLGVEGAMVVLDNKTFFHGSVMTAEGLPVADALIRANQGPKQAEGVHIGTIWTEGVSDEYGNYRLYVQDDMYDIQTTTQVGVARYENVDIKKNEAKHFDIVLDAGLTLRAQVLDSNTNEPVESVRLFDWQHPGLEGYSDANGIIVIENVMPGKFEFNVEAKQYTRWWSQQCVSEWKRYSISEETGWQRNFGSLDFDIAFDMEPVTIFVEKAVRITGKVFDPNGNSVSDATVTLAHTGTGNSITGDTRYSFTTDENGNFEMLVPASKKAQYNILVHDGKYNEWRTWSNGVTEPFHTEPGQELTDVELWLTRPGIVRGTVTDKLGKPITEQKVRAHAFDKLGNRYYDPTTKTDSQGYFELKFVRPGKHYIQVDPFWLTAEQAPEQGSQVIEIQAGESVEIIGLGQ